MATNLYIPDWLQSIGKIEMLQLWVESRATFLRQSAYCSADEQYMLQVVWTDHHTGLQTLRTDLVTDRGISWEAAFRKLEHERFSPDDNSGFRISRRPMFGRVMVVLAIQKTAKGNLFDISRPNTGASFFDMEV